MQHLIKRSTGPRARNAATPDAGSTLAERLAASRSAARREAGFEDAVEHEELVENLSPSDGEPDTEAIIQAAKAERDAAGGAAITAKSCLIVDDSRVIRKVAARIMVSLGYDVTEAENGEEALARCRKGMPHLVLTDWNMPVMSGLDFVVSLRAMATDRAPTIIFCTSKGDAQDIHAGIKAGADDYIVKPFEESDIRAKLTGLGVPV